MRASPAPDGGRLTHQRCRSTPDYAVLLNALGQPSGDFIYQIHVLSYLYTLHAIESIGLAFAFSIPFVAAIFPWLGRKLDRELLWQFDDVAGFFRDQRIHGEIICFGEFILVFITGNRWVSEQVAHGLGPWEQLG